MKPRVLYLSPVGQLGGAERCLLTMIAALRDAGEGIQPHVISGTDGPLIERARALGATAEVLEMPAALSGLGESGGGRITVAAHILAASPAIWAYARKLRSEIHRINPDTIHSNGVKTHLLTRFVGKGSWRVLWHIHDFLSQRAMMSRLARPCSRYADGAIAISRAVAEDIRPLLPHTPVHVILNAVDTSHFTPPVQRHESSRVTVGLVATYAKWKGHDVFLDAAAEVLRRRRVADIRFRIIGGPIYKTPQSQFSCEQLQARAADLGISDYVEFLDFQADPLEAYRALDIVVHASTRPEPFGLTIAEAMSCGRAVIVSNAGGATELFTHGHDALGVPPAQVGNLADAIEQLSLSPALRRTLGDNARRSAVKRFGMPRLGRQLADLYAGRPVTDENPPSPRADTAPSRS